MRKDIAQVTDQGLVMTKLDDVVACCNNCLIESGKAPDGTVPYPESTMTGTFHFSAGDVAPFLRCVATCLQGKGQIYDDLSSIFSTQEEFLAARLVEVAARINAKTKAA
jgi:hypothetical protein